MKQRYEPQLVAAPVAPKADSSHPLEGAATAQPLFEVKDLADIGATLPVGIPADDGTRSRVFRLRPFRLKEEKALSKLKDENKGATIGTFVADTLSLMVQTIGPHNFDSMKDQSRRYAIAQMTMADVLYVYLYLRYEALGADEPVVMGIRCPNCTNEYRWYGDLGTLDVRVVPDAIKDLKYKYKLRDGIPVNGKLRHELTLSPLTWGVFMKPEFSSPAKRIAATLTHSIVGIEGIDGPASLSEAEMDELTKYDYSGLIASINEHSPGPQLVVKPKCPACDFVAATMLDWGWDSFFARSAQPMTGGS